MLPPHRLPHRVGPHRRPFRPPLPQPHRNPPAAPSTPPPSTPLATSLQEAKDTNPQSDSPLFSSLPAEIRSAIWEYALLAYPDPDPARQYPADARWHRPGTTAPRIIATQLLRTCRRVYLEAYFLPASMNPVVIYAGDVDDIPTNAHSGANAVRALPAWAFACIQSLDVSFQQIWLESHRLAREAQIFLANERSNGVRITANPFAEATVGSDGALVPPGDSARFAEPLGRDVLDALERREEGGPLVDGNGIGRRITSLTLRLGRTDWWTWAAVPGDLGLEPTFRFDEKREAPRAGWFMRTLAQRRRSSQANNEDEQTQLEPEKRADGGWAADVARFPDLRELELVLETFGGKEAQLNSVVDCARTWTFPLGDGAHQLRFDRVVEAYKWVYEGAVPNALQRMERANEIVVRVVRFQR